MQKLQLQTKEQHYKLGYYVILSIFCLVFIHEMGHYVVADHYNLDPKLNIGNFDNHMIEDNGVSIAYVSIGEDVEITPEIMKEIALAGPFAVLVMGLFFALYIFYKVRQSGDFWLIFAICVLCLILFLSVCAYLPIGYIPGSDIWLVIHG